MNSGFLFAGGATIAVTALIHAILGEKRLIQPLYAMREGVLASDHARMVIRLAWHLTTVLMLLTAAYLFAEAIWPGTVDPNLIALTGVTYLLVGLLDAVLTKGKHIGWWFLTAGGIFPLLSFI